MVRMHLPPVSSITPQMRSRSMALVFLGFIKSPLPDGLPPGFTFSALGADTTGMATRQKVWEGSCRSAGRPRAWQVWQRSKSSHSLQLKRLPVIGESPQPSHVITSISISSAPPPSTPAPPSTLRRLDGIALPLFTLGSPNLVGTLSLGCGLLGNLSFRFPFPCLSFSYSICEHSCQCAANLRWRTTRPHLSQPARRKTSPSTKLSLAGFPSFPSPESLP
mmetsp:Transcript_24864/g.81834  ORF Transcript_24864/g.81834 Transcript_24864/m.81834 type:complete len:220 (+) Transcript_24864:1402-2061(+)